jgi:hypothetical protein
MKLKNNVIAIACADIHLSLNPPAARAEEPNWFEAMARPLLELNVLAKKYDCPVLCAGDVFDRWNSPPELINFALQTLPDGMIVIPGQHDLPNHSMAEIERSAFWTLIKSGKIKITGSPRQCFLNLPAHRLRNVNCAPAVYGFGWGSPFEIPTIINKLNIALIHKYFWVPGAGYPNAPAEDRAHGNAFRGYQCVITGDNHISFEDGNFFNCGSLMRLKSDQGNHKPSVVLIYESGVMNRHYLDISKDVFNPTVKDMIPQSTPEFKELFEQFDELKTLTLDFEQALTQVMNKGKTPPAVRQHIERAVESGKH